MKFSRKRSKDTVINRLLCRINLNSFSNYYIAIFLYENISMKLFFDILLGYAVDDSFWLNDQKKKVM
jgi:hypothetical protein